MRIGMGLRGAAFALAALFIGACASAGPATTSTTEPTAAPKAPAPIAASAKPFIPVGAFKLTPRHAPAGASVTAAATGLAPNLSYDLVWGSAEGSWRLFEDKIRFKGREFREVRTKVASATTDAAGSFSTTFVVPSGFGFDHDVMVIKGDEMLNKSLFSVDMQVTISPQSGPVGTPVTIEAKGIGYKEMQNSWLLSYDNKFTGWLSSVTTTGSAKAVIPATGNVGTHVITILHGHVGAPYLNMQQSPQPDRPQFRIPFTVTEGPAVLPPPLTTQSFPDRVTLPDRGNVWFEPQVGNVGSRTTLHAKGLRPNADVELVWTNTASYATFAGSGDKLSHPADTQVIGKVRTDAAGAFEWTYTIPDEAGGQHPFEVRAGGQVLGSTAYFIQPSVVPPTALEGPSGTEFTIQMYGLYATETGKITNLVYDNAYAGYSCSFNSGGNVQITFRASGEPGWHFIDLYPGIYIGEETNPINYRIPQLTASADHPGERMPIFRFAFRITAP